MQGFITGTCAITVRLVPSGPWMVRGQTERETFTDSRGQQNRREVLFPLLDMQGRPLLPASSLKGVLRSTAERILRTMHPDRDPQWIPLADDPFVREQAMLSNGGDINAGEAQPAVRLPMERGRIADSELREWLEQQDRSWFDSRPEYADLMDLGQKPRFDPSRAAQRIYKVLSPASQLFGCTLHAGLLTLDDAHTETRRTQYRSHVAIDRFTQGVGAGPFLEALSPADAPLVTTLTITNFALWQIALLGLVFQEFNLGYTGVGGGTRKGQGQVRIDMPQVVVRYAEHAYPFTAGIVSAQAQLARVAGGRYKYDLPDEVVAIESNLPPLLADLRPQPSTDWREAGMRTLLVQEENVKQLFRQAVQQAWRPWVRAMRREAVA